MPPTNDSIREEFHEWFNRGAATEGLLMLDKIADWWLSKKEEWEESARGREFDRIIDYIKDNQYAEGWELISMLQGN